MTFETLITILKVENLNLWPGPRRLIVLTIFTIFKINNQNVCHLWQDLKANKQTAIWPFNVIHLNKWKEENFIGTSTLVTGDPLSCQALKHLVVSANGLSGCCWYWITYGDNLSHSPTIVGIKWEPGLPSFNLNFKKKEITPLPCWNLTIMWL